MTLDELAVLVTQATAAEIRAKQAGEHSSARCYRDIIHNANELIKLRGKKKKTK